MKTTLNLSVTVDIPSTPREWELYIDHPDAEEAAMALYLAVRAVIAETPHDASPADLSSSVIRLVYPVMRRFRAAGAWDSEPTYHLRRTLATVYGEDRVYAAI